VIMLKFSSMPICDACGSKNIKKQFFRKNQYIETSCGYDIEDYCAALDYFKLTCRDCNNKWSMCGQNVTDEEIETLREENREFRKRLGRGMSIGNWILLIAMYVGLIFLLAVAK